MSKQTPTDDVKQTGNMQQFNPTDDASDVQRAAQKVDQKQLQKNITNKQQLTDDDDYDAPFIDKKV